jgi:hypothetical protein
MTCLGVSERSALPIPDTANAFAVYCIFLTLSYLTCPSSAHPLSSLFWILRVPFPPSTYSVSNDLIDAYCWWGSHRGTKA